MRTRLSITGAVIAVLVAATSGCRSSYSSRYAYSPRPVHVAVRAPEESGSIARAVLSVVGLRRPDEDAGLPAEMHLRIRIESTSAGEIVFDPSRAMLLSADLEEFGPVRVVPELGAIAPGDVVQADLYFPLPAGRRHDKLDLNGLSLRFGLRQGSATVVVDASFERRWRNYGYYHGPYYGPHWAPYWGPYWGPYPRCRVVYGTYW